MRRETGPVTKYPKNRISPTFTDEQIQIILDYQSSNGHTQTNSALIKDAAMLGLEIKSFLRSLPEFDLYGQSQAMDIAPKIKQMIFSYLYEHGYIEPQLSLTINENYKIMDISDGLLIELGYSSKIEIVSRGLARILEPSSWIEIQKQRDCFMSDGYVKNLPTTFINCLTGPINYLATIGSRFDGQGNWAGIFCILSKD